ncbi:hypothetical protein DPMN_085403 [Dreissena polymorpha]|uniref:Uncharacterized protein n=1 Tax=Dreissena polymorpha TaxID=45954 RepID=A0A9D3YEZ8_DREPO|nr:hypothetical protein DPMN_085403 [Dreissena polymorpha]
MLRFFTSMSSPGKVVIRLNDYDNDMTDRLLEYDFGRDIFLACHGVHGRRENTRRDIVSDVSVRTIGWSLLASTPMITTPRQIDLAVWIWWWTNPIVGCEKCSIK